MSTPRFGIVGAGNIGRIHLEALRAAGLPVVAIADPSEAALERAKELAPQARLYSDWRELLKDDNVTAVNICTINALHFPILREVIASGKHAFCEKTMTANAEDARKALTMPVPAGVVVQTGYMKRFFPASIWAREHIAEIGQPISATVRSYQGGFGIKDLLDMASWRGTAGAPSSTRQFACGGMLNMAGSHMLDMTAWLLGTPRTITCRTWSPADYDVEIHSHGLFQMEQGTLVHFEACLSHLDRTGPYGNGWDELIQITGTQGRLEITYPTWDKPLDNPAKVRLYRKATEAWEEPEMPRVNPFQLELEVFSRACTEVDTSITPGIREGAVVDLWIAACYESAASGLPVEFGALP